MKRILALITLLFGTLCSQAATVTAVNTTIGAVSNALALCAPFDTLRIPNGTASWTNGLYVTNCVDIIGESRTGVIISNAIPGGTAATFGSVFQFNLMSHSSTSRLGNLSIVRDPSQTTANSQYGVLVVGDNKDGRRMAITNVHFFRLMAFNLRIEGALGGISNSHFDFTNIVAVYGFHANWNGGDSGHGSWATNDNFGTDQFWFIENCGINNLDTTRSFTCIDGFAGFRYVSRHVNYTNGTEEGHGPEAELNRGTRAKESYFNRYVFNGGAVSGIGSYTRSGVQLYFSNSFDGVLGTNVFNLTYFRRFEKEATWGGVHGTNLYDQMIVAPAHTNLVVSTNGIDTRAASVTIVGTPFSANQYQGYTINRRTDLGGNGDNNFSVVLSNTTATLYYALGQNGQLHFATGDAVWLYQVPGCLDQQGFGMGSLMTGSTLWATNNQVLSPCYEWGNTNTSGVDMDFGIPDTNPSTVLGIHAIEDTVKPGYTPYTDPNPIFYPASSGAGTVQSSLSGGALINGGASLK